MRRALAQWWRDRRFAHIGAELENIWRQRESLAEHERRLMLDHERLAAAELNDQTAEDDMVIKLLAKLLARPAVADWLIRRAQRTPYTHIVTDGVLYMERFWLFNPYPNTGGSGADRPRWQFPISIRIHHIVQPDQDRHLHDHPWNARTFILRGWYHEMRPVEAAAPGEPGAHDMRSGMIHISREAGETAALKFGEYHRITDISDGGVWTMFVTGKYRGTWGFLVDGVKVQWRKYLGILEPKSADYRRGYDWANKIFSHYSNVPDPNSIVRGLRALADGTIHTTDFDSGVLAAVADFKEKRL